MSESPKHAGQAKHRACDECRSRKLACTKEPDGCFRCRRDGVSCVYSVQRPMGRPRKRPRCESDLTAREASSTLAGAAASSSNASVTASTTASAAASTAATTAAQPSEVDMEGLSFLADQAATPGSFFFDLFSLGETGLDPMTEPPIAPAPVATLTPAPAPAQQPAEDVQLPLPLTGPSEAGQPFSWGSWGVPEMSSIDFGSALDDDDTLAGGFSQDAALEEATTGGVSPATLISGASCSSGTSGTAGTAGTTPHTGQSPSSQPCLCPERLCAALGSLRQLPADVTTAIRAARDAARAAHDAVQCANCSPPVSKAVLLLSLSLSLSQSSPPTMQMFQSMAMLGALLPAIARAYRQIIAMVDAEAVRAVAARQRLSIAVRAYGGVWGGLAPWEKACYWTSTLEGSLVEPPLWRLVVRALLKVDVYGIRANKDEVGSCKMPMSDLRLGGSGDGNNDNNDGSTRPRLNMDGPLSTEASFSVHLGLRDIVELMEMRYQTWQHACLEAALEAGQQVAESAAECWFRREQSDQHHSCRAVIDVAKREIDKLVIV